MRNNTLEQISIPGDAESYMQHYREIIRLKWLKWGIRVEHRR